MVKVLSRIEYDILIVWGVWGFIWLIYGFYNKNWDNILYGLAFLMVIPLYFIFKLFDKKRKEKAPCYSDVLESISGS